MKKIAFLIIISILTSCFSVKNNNNLTYSYSTKNSVDNNNADIKKNNNLSAENYQSSEKPDPLKPVNKVVFNFNFQLDKYFLKPTADAYHHLPGANRLIIYNVLSNLNEPQNVINGALQRDKISERRYRE